MQKIALSIAEAAATVSLSTWTLRKWLAQGKLVPVRLGRRVCVTPEALRRLVSEGMNGPGAKKRRK